MLGISECQLALLEKERTAKTLKSVESRVAASHSWLAEDEGAISNLVVQLFDAGFASERDLLDAANSLIRIALRNDTKAAEARAIADAILFHGYGSPGAARVPVLTGAGYRSGLAWIVFHLFYTCSIRIWQFAMFVDCSKLAVDA